MNDSAVRVQSLNVFCDTSRTVVGTSPLSSVFHQTSVPLPLSHQIVFGSIPDVWAQIWCSFIELHLPMPDTHHFSSPWAEIKPSFIMPACVLCLQLCQSAPSMLSYGVMTSILPSSLRLGLQNGASTVSACVLCLKRQCASWSLTCDEVFTSLPSSSSTSFLFTIKSLTSTPLEEESKEYVIATHKCNKSKSPEQQSFPDLIKAECVHMHTSSFNLKEFSVAGQQPISLCQLGAHMAIQHISGDECSKVMSGIRMPSSLMVMSLQVITDNALCILKGPAKWRNQRLTVAEKLSMVLQCFEPVEVNVGAFQMTWRVDRAIFSTVDLYWPVQVTTLYKQKADKMQLVNWFDSDGRVLEDSNKWQKEAITRENAAEMKSIQHEFNALIISKFLNIERGSCLTFEQIEKLVTGNLQLKEKELFLWMLYNQEAALAFDYSEMDCLKEEVQPLMKIKTIEHTPWQASSFLISKALILKVTVMLKEQKANSLLKKCDEPYQNFWFLIKKKTLGEYWKIDAAMELNHIMWRDVNLPPSVDGFFKEFAGMHVVSLINMFSEYD